MEQDVQIVVVKKKRKRRTRLRKLKDKNNVEKSEINCKVCGVLKTRILAGKWKKDKKWVDEQGRSFNGKVCPDCHSKGVYQARFIKGQVNE